MGELLKIQSNCLLTDWVWEETGEPGGNPRRHGDNEQATQTEKRPGKKPLPSAVKPQCPNWPLSHHAALGRSVKVLIAQFPRSPGKHAKKPYTASHIPNQCGKHSSLNQETTHRKQFFFFIFPFFFGPVSSENQSTFKTPVAHQNAQQFRHKWRWMLLTTCGCVLRCLPFTVGVAHWGLCRLVQSRLKTKHTQEKVRALYV